MQQWVTLGETCTFMVWGMRGKNIPLSIKCLIVLFFQLRGNVLLAAHSAFVLTRSITSGCGWICRVWFLHELRFSQSALAKIAFKRRKVICRCPASGVNGINLLSTWKPAAAVEAVFGSAAPKSSLMQLVKQQRFHVRLHLSDLYKWHLALPECF